MKEFGIYLLQMASWLTAFWLVYQLLLRKETYFELNRWFLISGLIVSIVAPLFPVRYQVLINSEVTLFVETSPAATLSTTTIEHAKPDILLIIYVLGAIISLLLLFFQLLKLKLIRLNGKSLIIDNQKVYQTGKNIVPFSTFGDVYIGNNLNDPDQLKCIVAHEKVHIIERHWADLLLLEVVRTLQWFNPILILYRKAMMQNHEYLADRGAIAQGISSQVYQGILANQMLGFQAISIANSFNRGNKNKRLKMMNANKSKSIFKLKPLLVLPLIAIILFAFAKPEYAYQAKTTKATTQETTINVKGKVVDKNGEPMPGASILLESRSNGCVSNTKGEFELKNVSPDDAIIVSFVGFQTIKKKVAKKINFKMHQSTLSIKVKKDRDVPPPPPPPVKEEEELLILEDTPSQQDAPQPPPFIIVEDVPHYPGGQFALAAYIIKETAKVNKKGTVFVNFTVSAKGTVEEVKVAKSSGDKTLDKKAIEIVEGMEKWTPGKQRGKPVSVKYNIEIEF